jgi:hypothetical protein
LTFRELASAFVALSLTAVFSVAMLAGCAGQNPIPKGLDELVGQPMEAAISRLGMPTEATTIADTKVYIWSTGGEGPPSKCTIRAVMRGEVIGSFDWEGNEGQCSHYALMLRAQSTDCRKGILVIRIWLLPC